MSEGKERLWRLREQIETFVPLQAQEQREKEMILTYMDRFDDLLYRTNEMAHFTASSLILNGQGDQTLMVYHNQYDSWSWTGGHADGEEDLLAVAIREAEEETGAQVRAVSEEILTLDILPVWGHEKRGVYVPSHLHLNLAYLLRADETAALRIKPDENSGVQWVPCWRMETISREQSMKPVYRKLLHRVHEYLEKNRMKEINQR